MRIEKLSKSTYEEWVNFNKRMYPTRDREHLEKLLYFRTYQMGERELCLNLLLLNDDGNIIGQILYNSTKCFFFGETKVSLWGFDFIIAPEMRKYAYGLDFLEYVQENVTDVSFASGIGDVALKLEKAYGSKIIGYLKKYVKIVNPLFLFSSIDRTIYREKYPEKLSGFVKVSEVVQLWDRQISYNSDMIEFYRGLAFLEWRFFKAPHDYVIYKSENTDNYFVVRTIIRKHITALVLVDYRCDWKNEKEFLDIVKTAQSLTNKLHLSVLITASSCKYGDAVLSSFKFRKIGRDRPITINKNIKQYKDRVNNRDLIFTTLADSDGELNW